jgi:hypothetical protein
MGYILSCLTIVIFILMGNKTVWGPIVGFFSQFLWAYYTIYVIKDYGLFCGVVFLAVVQLRNWIKWRKENNVKCQNSAA